MIKNILAVAIVVALGACSSSDSDDTPAPAGGPTTPTDGGPTTPTDGGPTAPTDGGPVVTPPGGGAGPMTATKAGSYTGNFGGANGVYVINNDNDIAGLAVNADGSAQSLFGNLGTTDTFTGSLRQYIHQESRPDAQAAVFGSVAGAADPLEIEVNIVNGQTISSTATSPTAVDLVGTTGSSVTPATEASLAGTWTSVHSFCEDDAAGMPVNCLELSTELTFAGSDVTGSTLVTGGTAVLINGAITEFGDAALMDFDWGDSAGYSGVVFFTPAADGRIAFVGENDGATISGLMTKQ